MTVFPGARRALDVLRTKGIKLALITNGSGDVQRSKIARFALEDSFDHIQIEGEMGFGKPEERAYLHALETLRMRAKDCWMIGDHLDWEVAAPQRLGIYSIWLDGYDRGLPPDSQIMPDRTIRNLADLLP